MAQKTLTSLDEFKTASGEKIFKVSYTDGTASFVANIEPNDSAFDRTQHVNKGCISASSGVIHNMYDTSTCLFHGLAARRHKYPYLDAYDYQHIYKSKTDSSGAELSNGMKSITQAQGALYAIDGLSKYGHYYVNDEIYSWLCRDNGYAFPQTTEVHTMLYDQKVLSGDFDHALSCIDNIQYNTLYEIPGGMTQDYASGAVFATTVKCKNQYDHEYSMKHGATANSLLDYARDYDEINSCNDLVYMLYHDRKQYVKGKDEEQNHKFAQLTSDVGNPEHNYKLPHVEVLKNINRGASASSHKSSLYSIDVNAPFLAQFKSALDSTSPEDHEQHAKISENVKSEIKNCIRQIVQKIAPANTQLFAVTVH